MAELNPAYLPKEHMPSEKRLRELLMGKKIVHAVIREENPEKWETGPTGYLTLSDGVVLKVWGNDGGCACSSGCYPLTELNTCDNIITNVEVEELPDEDYGPCSVAECEKDPCFEHEGAYRIFVFADNQRINVASFEGTDGNGYYGTGWWLSVSTAHTGPNQEVDRG